MTEDDLITRNFMAFRIERVHARLTAQSQKILAERSGLTHRQWWIIADMMAEKPRTATELAEIGDIDKGLLSRNLKALAEMGLVATESDPTDLRVQVISLTEKGREMHAHTVPVMRKRNEHLLRGIAREDLEATLRVLDQLEKAATRTRFDLDE